MFGEEQHHLSARLGATRLDEAQMAWRDACIDRKLELAELASLTPLSKLPTELAGAPSKSHPISLPDLRPRFDYLRGKASERWAPDQGSGQPPPARV